MSNNGVMIITLKDVQELRKNGEVARRILLLHRDRKRPQGEQLVEIVCGTQIERFTFPKASYVLSPFTERGGERMSAAKATSDFTDCKINVTGQFGHRPSDFAPPN